MSVSEPPFNPFLQGSVVSLPAPEQLRTAERQSPLRWAQRILSGSIFIVAVGLLFVVIAGIAPLFMGWRPFVIVSGSMEPMIHTGAVALTRPVPSSELEVGDIIAYNPRGDAALPVIHRIVAVQDRNGTRFVTTRGDANTGNDAEIALPAQALLVIGSIPLAGFAVYSAAQPLGTILLIWVPLILLGALWLKDQIMRWRSARR